MLTGILFSILAGTMIALQGIFNARMGDEVGLWHTNSFVHGTGFLVAFFILIFNEKLNLASIKDVPPYYLLGGVMGVIIILSVMKGIGEIGASYSVTIVIITQIILTAGVNYFGFFGEPVITFSLTKIIGLVLMISGILVYQLS